MPDDRRPLHAEDGRLRVGWRVVIVVVSLTLATSLATVVAVPFEGAGRVLAAGVAMAVVGIGAFALLAPSLDRRELVTYGLRVDRRWWTDLAAGLVIGLIFGATTFGTMIGGGWAEVAALWSPGAVESTVWTGLVAGTIYFVAVAVWEEMTFRGYVISNTAEALADRRPATHAGLLAVAISLPIFAVGHVNQFASSASVLSSALWWLAAGALLGLAYLSTAELALPIGIHIALNLGANRIFALPGAETTEPLAVVFRLSLHGPDWIVGTGGLAWFIGLAASSAALWLWLRVRGRPLVDPRVVPEAEHVEGREAADVAS